MIDLKKVSLTVDEKKLLTEVALTIRPGECVVICGSSGSGKTSLIRLLTGLIPELYPGEITGFGHILGNSIPPSNFYDYVKHIGVVFQNPKTQFFTTDVYSELAFSMENYGMPPASIKERIQEVVSFFDLDAFLKSSVFQLSGGEKQRVAFASATMMAHKLFLFDEPSSNLDQNTIAKLLEQMKRLKENGMTIVVAEHRLHYLNEIADRYVYLENGQVTQVWTKSDLSRFSANRLSELGLRTLHPTKVPLELLGEKSPLVEQAIAVHDVSYAPKNSTFKLRVPALTISPNEVIGITGPNGSGKTTLVSLLTGVLKPQMGSITYQGKKMSPKDLRSMSYLVMQDVNFQLFFETVYMELTTHAKRLDLYEKVVTGLGLNDLLEQHPQTLSGGEKQRVVIGTAILSGKQLLVFDEPTSGLDYRNMIEVSRLLVWLKEMGLFIVLITHDMEFLVTACDRMLPMENGQIKKISSSTCVLKEDDL